MINADNYELYFFQYQEGMLDEAARREVEAFMGTHPQLAEEMTLYAEAPVLTAEDVAYPDKESLRHRAVPTLWWRCAAAAAAVAGICVTALLTLPTSAEHESQPLMARTETAVPKTVRPQPEAPRAEISAPARPVRPTAAATAKPAPVSATQPIAEAPEAASMAPECPEPAAAAPLPLESQLLAEENAGFTADSAARPAAQGPQQVEVVIYNCSDTPWRELLADRLDERYPEQARRVTLLAARAANTAAHIKSNPIVKFIRSIV